MSSENFSAKQLVTQRWEKPNQITKNWEPKPLDSVLDSNTKNILFSGSRHHLGPQTHQPQHQQAQQQLQQQLQYQAAVAAANAAAVAANSQRCRTDKQSIVPHPYPHSMPQIVIPANAAQQQQQQYQPQTLNFDAFVFQTMIVCEAWKAQMEESNRKAAKAEQQLDEARSHIRTLKDDLVQLSICSGVGDGYLNSYKVNDLRGNTLPELRCILAKLRGQLDAVENALYLETAVRCMKCEKNNRSVTLVACNHFVLCGVCATTQLECPYCYKPVTFYV